jgi:hypothetical protein
MFNELNARLVGWLVDLELDGRLQRSGAEDYLRAPSVFVSGLQLDDPYYAVAFSVEEMGDVRPVMMRRLADAFQKRESVYAELERNAVYLLAIERFVQEQGIAEARFQALREQLENRNESLWLERDMLDQVVDLLAQTIRRCSDEPDRQSESYFRKAATHPFFKQMRARVEAMHDQLEALVRETAVSPFPAYELARAHAAGATEQITLETLLAMMAETNPDSAAPSIT